MSKVYLEDSVLTDIADAIREKTGESGTITPADMPTEIESISGGGEGLNDDFRTYVENSTGTLSFDTYTSPGTTIRKSLINMGITDINMPNLSIIQGAQIPINNTIARKLETYPLTNLSTYPFVGECDKLELLQSISCSSILSSAFQCPFVALPNTTGYVYINDGGTNRDIFWTSEDSSIAGGSSATILKTRILIITRTKSVVSLTSVSSYYLNKNIIIFVPASLLGFYRTATNWSTMANQIYSIEDNEVALKGYFNELDKRYSWTSGSELTLIERLQRQKILQWWQISYDELIMIANDLADKGENSEYYNYRECLIINDGLYIPESEFATKKLYLFITDTFKYKDRNDDLIPLSGMIASYPIIKNNGNQKISIGEWYGLAIRMNNGLTNIGGFGESTLYSDLNDTDGAIFKKLPSSLTDNLVEWKIDNNNTALLAPLSENEVYGTIKISDPTYEIYNQLTFFSDSSGLKNPTHIWGRSPLTSSTSHYFTFNRDGTDEGTASHDGTAANATNGLVPAIALGKKGINND